MRRFNILTGNTSRCFNLTRWIALLSLVLAFCVMLVPPAKMQRAGADVLTQEGATPVYVPNQVVVQLNPGFDIATVAAMYGLNPVPLRQLQYGVPPVTSYLMEIVDGSTVEQKVATLRADITRIAFAEPNYLQGAPEARRDTWSIGDSYGYVVAGRKWEYLQWARKVVRVDVAQQTTRGNGITVAVLDTGIDLNHPAFAGRLVPGYDFVDNDADPSEEGSPEIGPYGHGTHVAGIIAMVAPEAKIMPIRVLGINGRGNAYTLAEAVKYAIEHGAHVINLSLSAPNKLTEVEDVFYHMLDGDSSPPRPIPGAVVVAAAGNSGTTLMEYPAAETVAGRPGREVLAVAASDTNDQLTSFSTRGNWVSVMAPGEQIISPVPHNRYGKWAGTSMAAPLVAGEVALIRAAFPLAEPKDIVLHVKATATFINSQVPRRIDIANALISAPLSSTALHKKY